MVVQNGGMNINKIKWSQLSSLFRRSFCCSPLLPHVQLRLNIEICSLRDSEGRLKFLEFKKMDSDSWIQSSSGYRRYQSRSDAYRGEEYEGEGELKAEFLCPFCAQDFDMVGLCCHIDEEHAIEAKNGVCPLCSKKVASDLVCHMTMQHGSLLKMYRKRRLRRGLSNLSFPSLRKDLREGKLQSLLGGSTYVVPTSNSEPDPLLNSFICNPTVADKFPSVQTLTSVETSPMEESIVETLADGTVQQPLLSKEDQKEKTQKCKFVQGLLLSTFLDDNLS